MSNKKSIEKNINNLDENMQRYLIKQKNLLGNEIAKYEYDIYIKLNKNNINSNTRIRNLSQFSDSFIDNFITPKYPILDNFRYYKDLLVDLYSGLFNYKNLLNILQSKNINVDKEIKNIENFSLKLADFTIHMEDYADKKTKLLRKLSQ